MATPQYRKIQAHEKQLGRGLYLAPYTLMAGTQQILPLPYPYLCCMHNLSRSRRQSFQPWQQPQSLLCPAVPRAHKPDMYIKVISVLGLVGDRGEERLFQSQEALNPDPAVLQTIFRNFPEPLTYLLKHLLKTFIFICQQPLVAHSTYIWADTNLLKCHQIL